MGPNDNSEIVKTPDDQAELILKWQIELSDEINKLDEELKNLMEKKKLIGLKIECFSQWGLSIYSQQRFKITVELEQILKDITKHEQKITFSRELLKKVESETK